MVDLSGPILKLSRAKYHITEICGAIDRLAKSKRYSFAVEQAGPTSDDYVLRARIAGKLPAAEFGVRVGDFAHNARCALDHLAYELSALGDADTKRHKIQFPICDSAATYESSEGRLLDGVADLDKQIIERHQPYNMGSGHLGDPLRILREINNTDKHRSIPVVTVVGRVDDIMFDETSIGSGITASGDAKFDFTTEAKDFFSYEGICGGVIREDGVIVAKIRTSSPDKVRLKVKPSLQLQFGVGLAAIAGRDVIEALTMILNRVNEVIGAFQSQGQRSDTTHA